MWWKNMKKIYKPILYYLGLTAGTIIVLYNYNILFSLYNMSYSNTKTYIICIVLKRLVELAVIGGICKVIQSNAAGGILLIMAGGITGGCISYKTLQLSNSSSVLINTITNSYVENEIFLNNSLVHVFLYSMIVAVIVLLYYIILRIFIVDKSCNKDDMYARLHGSIGGYGLIITILLINMLIEVKILKFF
jgi:hypothetical protein